MAANTSGSVNRNILIIGKTGAGKASIANAIVKSKVFEIGAPMQKSRHEAFIFKEHDSREGYFFKIALVDIYTNSTQDDQNLEKNISNALDSLKTLHLVLFVLKCEPFDEHLWASFNEAVHYLGQDASAITTIIVTWCDLMNETKIQQELQKYPTQVIGFIQKEIVMVSLLRSEYVIPSMQPHVESKKKESEKILQNLCEQAVKEVQPIGSFENISTPAEMIRPISPNAMLQSQSQHFRMTRNILFFGKAGAGKSTVANAIIGSDVFPVERSTIRQATLLSACDFLSSDGCMYRVALVDTVGVADSHQSRSLLERTNNGITKLKSVNLILFVFKLERFTTQERDSFQEVMRILNKTRYASTVTALVVTCCDQKSEEAREEIKHELRKSEVNVVQFARKGIFLVGFPALNQLPPPLRSHYEQSRKIDEVKLRELTTESHQIVPIQPAREF